MTPRLRCRYQVWEGGRGIRSYQCQRAAKDERELYIGAHRINGELISERIERLPVCGTHRNAWDRDPRPTVHSAYQWSESGRKEQDAPTVAKCPLCSDPSVLRLTDDWQQQGQVPIIGCGNPWHYATASLGDAPYDAEPDR